jgi:preprotein translocase subunit SecG
MIDVFMLIMTIVLAVLLVVISLWLLIYYGHPDDRWDCFAIFCKIVMVQFI